MGDLTKLMISVVLISMVLMGSFMFLGSFQSNYIHATDFDNSTTAFQALNQTTVISSMAENITGNIQEQEGTETDFADLIVFAGSAATQTVLMMLSLPGIMISVIGGFVMLGAETGIALGWVAGSLIIIVTIVIIMAIINSFQSKKEL